MKKLIILFLVGGVLALTAFTAGDITSIAIGTALPKADVTMKDAISGKETTLSVQTTSYKFYVGPCCLSTT